jgi:hypothetical protein
MQRRALVVGLTLWVILFTLGPIGQAAPLLQARSIITYPTDGMTVSGQVEITGIATHPNLDFYQIRYAAGPAPTGESQWVDFAIVEGTQVENSALGTWDTSTVPDGQYTLALAVWGANDANSPYVYFVTNLTVNNAQPAETPTPTPVPQPTAPLATPTTGPTPTPVTVEQPATPTPRPTATPEAPGLEGTITPEAEDEGPSMTLDVAELGNAFCTGGLLTILLLSVWGGYLLIKAGIRWYLRQRSNPFSGNLDT